jgi:gamma-tubulin complex component 2
VISRRTILRYQLIFRFLLHLKHVEQLLCSTWIDHKSPAWRTPLPSHPDMEQWRSRVFLLRARMLAYVQQIIAYATFDVLEPNWRNLEAKLAKVQTVDQLLRDHIDFLDTCSKECMLTNAKMLRVRWNSPCNPCFAALIRHTKIYSKLVHTCFTFVQYSPQFTRSANQVLSALNESGGDPTSAPMEKRWDFLEKFEKNFHHFFAVRLC